MKHRFVSSTLASAAFGFCLLAAAGFSSPARAQSSPDQNVQALLDRVDRLQRELTALQRRVYQGGTPDQPAQGSGAPISASSGGSATDLEVRLESIEQQVQDLRGAVEQANYQNKTVQDRLEKLSSDVNFRLDAVEKKVGITPGSYDASTAGGAATSAAPAEAGAPTNNTAQPKVLGQVPVNSNSSAPGAVSASPPPASAPLIPDETKAASVTLPAGSAKEQYEYAFGLIRQNNYAGGEQALKQFVSAHPNDSLAGNAQYWLGRTYYARNDYNDAIRAFAEAYQKYPKNQYAAENLLYLGRSLSGIKKKSEACATYTRLLREYPKASEATKSGARAEQKKLSCG
ncbi:MAG TPA: tol-pal system protein YbgF [Alphaproteobacteria bacterium]|nr:tol-pal system protein YbgF [Alphaproteobacteria bacterium]